MKNKRSTFFYLFSANLFVILIIISCSSVPLVINQPPKLLAHRGLAQTFDMSKVKANTNTASIINVPEHNYIENTIESMKVSFDYGADIVEFDIRMTKDNQLAVFHDYCLDYRTNVKGNVSDYSLDELKKIDVGYGYTADNGETYPLRGLGIGKLPSIDDVLSNFENKDLLIHIRDDGETIGNLLIEKFSKISDQQIEHISVYGNDTAIKIIRAKYPSMKVLSARIIKKAFIDYELFGWLGIIPKSIQNIELHMPMKYAKLLWGWPDKFVNRMNKVNTRFVLVNGDGQWSEGFDSIQDLEKIPSTYSGYIWTERIDKISKYYDK